MGMAENIVPIDEDTSGNVHRSLAFGHLGFWYIYSSNHSSTETVGGNLVTRKELNQRSHQPTEIEIKKLQLEEDKRVRKEQERKLWKARQNKRLQKF